MIVGYHLIFRAYGFWLPNDPRGSWSDFVGSWELYRFGPATKTAVRHSVAHAAHNRSHHLAAKQALKHPLILFNGIQARAVGRGFANYIQDSRLPVWACAILPDHVHLVTGQPHIPIERIAIQLKGAATEQLVSEGIHPFAGDAKCWARGEWKVFLDPADLPRAVRCVENNPLKEGKPRQHWPFVQPYPG